MASKPLTVARLVPSSETLDHLIRYLSTWSGSDKLFMVIQYAVKLIVPLLAARARLQHKFGLKETATIRAAEGWSKLGVLVGDARALWRIWGLLPILQWLITLERNPPPTRKLLIIERLQGWAMLAYYPVEHLYYLASHGIVPAVGIDIKRLGILSCRFWAAYVLLQFVHLREDRKLLLLRERSIKKGKQQGTEVEMKASWDGYWNEMIINAGYLPLTIHWSLEKGLFKNEIWVGIFGMIAGVASFRSGWKATALPG